MNSTRNRRAVTGAQPSAFTPLASGLPTGALPTARPAKSNDPAAGKDPWEDNTPATNYKVATAAEASDGAALTKADDFAPANAETNKKGLYALAKADLFNLLCIPPYLANGNVDTSLVSEAAAYCERGDTAHAVRLCSKAIAQAETLDSPRARASAYWNASVMQANRGDIVAAVPLAERALSLLSEGQDARNLARLRTGAEGLP